MRIEPGEFTHGMLTAPALAELHSELRRLLAKFAALHLESVSAPLHQHSGTGVLLALRGWEPRAFAALRRTASDPARP